MVSATLVSALAALGALWFARETVRETRELRREDRLARLPELVADLGTAALRIAHGASIEKRTTYPVARLRLEAALASTGEKLPRCDVLVRTDFGAGSLSLEDITAKIEAALDELSERLRAAP